MPLNTSKMIKTPSKDMYPNFGSNATSNYKKIIDDSIPSYKYMSIKDMYPDGINGELNTLSSDEGSTVNGNTIIADGVYVIPDTLFIVSAEKHIKYEYDEDNNKTGKIAYEGISYKVVNGSVAVSIIERNNGSYVRSMRELKPFALFNVLVPAKNVDKLTKEELDENIGEFVQFDNLYLIPKWHSFGSGGSFRDVEANAEDICILSKNKQ